MTRDGPSKASALRRKAEGLLAKEVDGEHAVTPTEADRLVHELQVHRIELELQNEQLVRAYDEATALRDKYCDLYDFAPIGYFTISTGGEILEMNLRGAAMLGAGRAELAGRGIKDFLQPESLSAFDEFLSATVMGLEEESATLLLRPIRRETIYVKVQGRFFDADSSGAPRIRLVMMDVTAVKFANDELQRSFEKFFTYWRP